MITIRDLGNAVWYRFYRGFLKCQLFLQLRMSLLDSYQPNPFGRGTRQSLADPRDCRARFDAFSMALPDEPLSVLDVGCNLGYFVFRMAESGGYCLGLDYERNAITAARALSIISNIPNVAFSQINVTAEAARSLPQVDVLIFLSVFHHIVRKEGLDAARDYMRVLAASARRYLVFDTGQPDEAGTNWAEDLAFMQPDPAEWIREFLIDLGFQKVEKVGAFASAVSTAPRYLFVASRQL